MAVCVVCVCVCRVGESKCLKRVWEVDWAEHKRSMIVVHYEGNKWKNARPRWELCLPGFQTMLTSSAGLDPEKI